MTVIERIYKCRIIEKMEKQRQFSKEIGVLDVSTFKKPGGGDKDEWKQEDDI